MQSQEKKKEAGLSLKFVEPLILDLNPLVSCVITRLNLHPVCGDDMVNTINTDNRRFLAIGTESGLLFFFDIEANKMLGWVRSDSWLMTVGVLEKRVLASGQNRKIQMYPVNKRKCVFELLGSPYSEGYSLDGIKFVELNMHGHIICNVGFNKFMIFSILTLKVLKRFSVKKSKELGEGLPQVIMSFGVYKNKSILAYMYQEDSHLYFYDLKQGKVVQTLRLYNPKDTSKKYSVLSISTLASEAGYFVVIIQFAERPSGQPHLGMTANSQLKSILYVTEYEPATKTSKLMMLEHIKGLKRIISCDQTRINRKEFVSFSNGMALVLGNSSGETCSIFLDFDNKKCEVNNRVRRSESGEEVSSVVVYKAGTIASTSDGVLLLSRCFNPDQKEEIKKAIEKGEM